MVKQNVFGWNYCILDVVYQHELTGVKFNDGKSGHNEQGVRIGDKGISDRHGGTQTFPVKKRRVYPTHGLGP